MNIKRSKFSVLIAKIYSAITAVRGSMLLVLNELRRWYWAGPYIQNRRAIENVPKAYSVCQRQCRKYFEASF